MPVREIRLFGDPILRSMTDPVVRFDAHTQSLVRDLVDTVSLPGRAGVAANQIGVGLRAFSFHVDGTIGCILNPVLAEVRGEPALTDEGCLSVPGFSFPRLRYPFARVTGFDRNGSPLEIEGDGLLAQALQHEIGHLDGELYIEGLAPEVKRRAMRDITSADWFRA
jgi:peptide deformylase